MLAYTYPLLSLFWTMLLIAGFVVWIWLLIAVFSDLFRSKDLGGWAKALWTIGVIIFPLFGVLLYLIVRGSKMRENAEAAQAQSTEEFETYVRRIASSEHTTTEQLSELAELRDRGRITDEEYEKGKAKILAA